MMLNIGSDEAINENNTLGGQAFTARPGLPKIVRAAAGHGAGARVRAPKPAAPAAAAPAVADPNQPEFTKMEFKVGVLTKVASQSRL